MAKELQPSLPTSQGSSVLNTRGVSGAPYARAEIFNPPAGLGTGKGLGRRAAKDPMDLLAQEGEPVTGAVDGDIVSMGEDAQVVALNGVDQALAGVAETSAATVSVPTSVATTTPMATAFSMPVAAATGVGGVYAAESSSNASSAPTSITSVAASDTVSNSSSTIVPGHATEDPVSPMDTLDAIDAMVEGITLKGSDGNDTIVGDAGNDVLSAGGGDNVLQGGAGNDVLTSGNGNNLLEGGSGDDVLEGNVPNGHTFMTRSIGRETLDGGDGSDVIYGGSGGSDGQIWEPTQGDLLLGGNGNDLFVMDGDMGGYSDMVFGMPYAATVDGGAGDDTLDLSDLAPMFSGSLTVTHMGETTIFVSELGSSVTAINVEHFIQSGAGANRHVWETEEIPSESSTGYEQPVDVPTQDDLGVYLISEDLGDQLLEGTSFDDVLQGNVPNGHTFMTQSIGRETLDGCDGNDVIYGGSGGSDPQHGEPTQGDLLLCGNGNDLIVLDAATVTYNDMSIDMHYATTVDGGAGDDTLDMRSLDWSSMTSTVSAIEGGMVMVSERGDSVTLTNFEHFIFGGAMDVPVLNDREAEDCIVIGGTGYDTVYQEADLVYVPEPMQVMDAEQPGSGTGLGTVAPAADELFATEDMAITPTEVGMAKVGGDEAVDVHAVLAIADTAHPWLESFKDEEMSASGEACDGQAAEEELAYLVYADALPPALVVDAEVVRMIA